MLSYKAGDQFFAILDRETPNLGGALTVSVKTILGATVVASQASSEIVLGGVHTGVYISQMRAPNTNGEYFVVWNDGTSESPYIEELVVAEEPLLGSAVFTRPLLDLTETLTAQAAIAGVTLTILSALNTVAVGPVAAVEGPAGTYSASFVAPAIEQSYIMVWHAGADYISGILRVTTELPIVVPVLEYEPDIASVAAILRARTDNGRNTEIGVFTSQTRPTDAQVRVIIAKAARTVAVSIGGDIPNVLIPEVKEIVALRAAMMIELSYFPEQVSANRSPYAQIKELYDEMLPLVRERVASEESLEVEDDTTLSSNAPAFRFPNNNLGGLVGWRSRW